MKKIVLPHCFVQKYEMSKKIVAHHFLNKNVPGENNKNES